MGMAAPVYYTVEMARALPDDGNRYEVVHGELLVTPAPRWSHQDVVKHLLVALELYLRRHPVATVQASPADLSWAPDILVQPDVFVVPRGATPIRDWKDIRSLLLVAEVLSPGTARYDRFTKRRLYQEFDVPTYWIVDADLRQVEIWTPRATFPVIERARLTWAPDGAGAPFELPLGELFRDPAEPAG